MSPRGQGDHAHAGMHTPSIPLPCSPYYGCLCKGIRNSCQVFSTSLEGARLPQPFSQVMRSGPLCVFRARQPLQDLHTPHGLKSPEQDTAAPGQGSGNPKTQHILPYGKMSHFVPRLPHPPKQGKHNHALTLGPNTWDNRHRASNAAAAKLFLFFLILPR